MNYVDLNVLLYAGGRLLVHAISDLHVYVAMTAFLCREC
jgi:hypothetical protein